MPEQNPARRFQLATKINALARGTKIVEDGLGRADDATVVEALAKVVAQAEETLELARTIAELAPLEKRDVDGAGPVILKPGQNVVVEAEGEDSDA